MEGKEEEKQKNEREGRCFTDILRKEAKAFSICFPGFLLSISLFRNILTQSFSNRDTLWDYVQFFENGEERLHSLLDYQNSWKWVICNSKPNTGIITGG